MVSPHEAAQTLDDARRVERRSAQAFGYRIASVHLILWGVVWILGYGISDLRPQYSDIAWYVLIPLGLVAGGVIGRMSGPRRTAPAAGAAGRRADIRYFGLMAVFAAFIGAIFAIMRPNGMQTAAFFPLMVAAMYAGVGLWLGVRYVVTGAVLAALTLGGFFYLPDHFALWMALAGGGALILAGIWFRSV